MSDFTAEDVQRGADALVSKYRPRSDLHGFWTEASADVLAAVLPEYAKRVREDMGLDAEQYRLGWEKGNQRGRVEALREAAALLRARADAEEGK